MSDYRLSEEDLSEFESFFRSINQEDEIPTTTEVSIEPPVDTYEEVEDNEIEEEEVLEEIDEEIDEEIFEEILEDALENSEPESPTEELLPENPEGILVQENTSRFSGAVWYEAIQNSTVLLAGLGGIGSYVGFLLSRLNIGALTLYDNDLVDATNLSGQLYSRDDIGDFKVTALCNMMRNYSNYNKFLGFTRKFTERNSGKKIMICGFDNMEARKTFFNAWLYELNERETDDLRQNFLFIDGRLAAEDFQVLCIRGDDNYNIQRYKDEFLFSSEEAEATICSYKQTSFIANMIASTMVNLFVNFIANQCSPVIERGLPFLTEYNAELMYFNTEH